MRIQTKFDTLHWLLAICSLMLITVFIAYASHMHSGSTKALGYVSFAGTITSIVLAVVAIFISVVQFGSSGEIERAIGAEVDRLSKVSSEIERVAADVAESHKGLNQRLDKQGGDLEETRRAISEALANFGSAQDKTDSPATNTPTDVAKYVDLLNRSGKSHLVTMAYYALAAGWNECLDDGEIKSRAIEKSLSDEFRLAIESQLNALIIALGSILNAMGILEHRDGIRRVSPEFLKQIREDVVFASKDSSVNTVVRDTYKNLVRQFEPNEAEKLS